MADKELTKALEEIKEFGFANSGRGFSCAKMAKKTLSEYKVNVDKPQLCEVLADMQEKAMDKNLCFRMFRDSNRSTEFITMYDVKEILSKYFA